MRKKICHVLVLSTCLAADVLLKMRRERSLEMIMIEKCVRLHTHSGQSHPTADTGRHTDVEKGGDN